MKTLSLLSLPALCLCFVAFIQPDFDGGKHKAFKEFLAEFEANSLPYSITVQEIRAMADEARAELKANSNGEEWTPKEAPKVLTRKYAEFLPALRRSKFSRMPPPEIMPVYRFEMKEDMIAVVYRKNMRYFRSSQDFEMAVFDKKGKLLDQKWLAGYNPSSTMSCSVNEDGIVTINEYENIWEKPLNSAGVLENQLVRMDIKETHYYQINKEGYFAELKEIPASGRASLN